MAQITRRQKQFLKALGAKEVSNLSKSDASQLIDKLLKEEKESGKTFPCPYCKQKFGPRPKRTKTCSNCTNKIVHLSGRFYTEEEAERVLQSDWQKEQSANKKADVNEQWTEEKEFRREFNEILVVGFKLRIGPQCKHAQNLDSEIVTLEDALQNCDLLPPFPECRRETCECEYESISQEELKPSNKKSLNKSSRRSQKKSGCSILFVIWAIILSAVLIIAN